MSEEQHIPGEVTVRVEDFGALLRQVAMTACLSTALASRSGGGLTDDILPSVQRAASELAKVQRLLRRKA